MKVVDINICKNITSYYQRRPYSVSLLFLLSIKTSLRFQMITPKCTEEHINTPLTFLRNYVTAGAHERGPPRFTVEIPAILTMQ